jgi:hypothetical protein
MVMAERFTVNVPKASVDAIKHATASRVNFENIILNKDVWGCFALLGSVLYSEALEYSGM